jgi:hypothetical protein
MWPFTDRVQRPIPVEAQRLLDEIPDYFIDDGCSNSPDTIWGFDLRPFCKIHDWRYCGRSHPAGTMHYANKLVADDELAENIGSALPWRWRFVRILYLRGVQIGGGFDAWNSCGPEDGELCRHNVELPAWMHSANYRALED